MKFFLESLILKIVWSTKLVLFIHLNKITLLNKKKQTNIEINDECQFGNFRDTLEPVKEGNFELLIIYLTKYPIKVREYTI